MPPPERYNTGYNIGAAGAVVSDGKLLLVRRKSRRGRGNWQCPGGFVEVNESIEQTAVREVEEESGVKAEVIGLLGMRSRYDEDNGNSTYMVLLMRPVGGVPEPDATEVDQAGFFTLEEILELEQVPPVNIEIAKRALDPKHNLLSPIPMKHTSGAEYTFFVG
jgi:ADP-ribose pyrophosphatase YjhB (NUDIX family)